MTQKTGDVQHLANQFLIAMPGMVDENFAGSVIYLCDHSSTGAMGLVINKPTFDNKVIIIKRGYCSSLSNTIYIEGLSNPIH